MPRYGDTVHGYSGAMDRLDHLEHLDKHLVDELALVARETIRDELRQQTRKQRRKAALYAASGALALYAGAALALALGLALSLGLPDWAAALITAVVLGVAAYVLRSAARPSASRPTAEHEGELPAGRDRVVGGTAPGMPPGWHGAGRISAGAARRTRRRDRCPAPGRRRPRGPAPAGPMTGRAQQTTETEDAGQRNREEAEQDGEEAEEAQRERGPDGKDVRAPLRCARARWSGRGTCTRPRRWGEGNTIWAENSGAVRVSGDPAGAAAAPSCGRSRRSRAGRGRSG